MAKKQKATRFSIKDFDMAHYRATEQYANAVDNLFTLATEEIARAASKADFNPDKPFTFDDYPKVKSAMQTIVAGLTKKVQTVVETGSRKQWLFSCKKNDAFINAIFNTSKLKKSDLKKMMDKRLDALAAFQKRKVAGMTLSQRVFKYTEQFREQIEHAIDVGLGEGRSAQELSRDVRQNLKDPNRLFRRVRDKRGNLVLSKAAQAFHPGQGVYRSSYKNAMRLTRSEINMAYRESDYQRWQALILWLALKSCGRTMNHFASVQLVKSWSVVTPRHSSSWGGILNVCVSPSPLWKISIRKVGATTG